MVKLLEGCPNCGGEFEIREIHCRACSTEIRSRYEPSPFDRLTAEQITFLELFIQARGNMRTLESILGVSYPTVRSRIDAIANKLRAGRPEIISRVPAARVVDGTDGAEQPKSDQDGE